MQNVVLIKNFYKKNQIFCVHKKCYHKIFGERKMLWYRKIKDSRYIQV